MGYFMFLFMFFCWRNTRTIKKLLYYLAVQDGYPKTFTQKFGDLLLETFNMRKQKKRDRKEIRKVQSNEPEPEEKEAQPEEISK